MTDKIKQARDALKEMYAVLCDSERWCNHFGLIGDQLTTLEKLDGVDFEEENSFESLVKTIGAEWHWELWPDKTYGYIFRIREKRIRAGRKYKVGTGETPVVAVKDVLKERDFR